MQAAAEKTYGCPGRAAIGKVEEKTQYDVEFKHAPLASSEHPVTRMIRLFPNPEPDALIECQLFDYTLAPDIGEHLYEALSYVWGDAATTVDIALNGRPYRVTENLHDALLHLRNPSLERVIWVDAVCINQKDEVEKGFQIQYMASIYGYASCVIVWLGQGGEGSEDAFRSLQATAAHDADDQDGFSHQAQIHGEVGSAQKDQAAIIRLLQRRWFRRIWVLQEVALARRVAIICGPAIIDGHIFCQGIRNVDLPVELRSLLSSVAYLISGAMYRHRFTGHHSENIPLPELIDMYHDREAGIAKDKVYALLGMSTSLGASSQSSVILRPDYALPIESLMRRVVVMGLGENVTVQPLKGTQTAVIEGQGIVLGRVTSVKPHEARHGRQKLAISFTADAPESLRQRASSWTIRTPAKEVMVHDVILHLKGAPGLTLVRSREDFFNIIMIRMTAQQDTVTAMTPTKVSDAFGSRRELPFTLVWDWEPTSTSAVSESMTASLRALLPHRQGDIEPLAARFNMAAAAHSAGAYTSARLRLEALRMHVQTLGEEHPLMLSCLDLIALTYKEENEDWGKVFELSALAIETRKKLQGTEHAGAAESVLRLLFSQGQLPQLQQVACHSEDWDQVFMRRLENKVRTRGWLTERELVRIMNADTTGYRLWLLLQWMDGDLPFTPAIVAEADRLDQLWGDKSGNGDMAPSLLLMLINGIREERVVEEQQVVSIVRSADRDAVSQLVGKFHHRLRITQPIIRAAFDSGKRSDIIPIIFGDSRPWEPLHRPVVTEAAVAEMARSSLYEWSVSLAIGLLPTNATIGKETAALIAAHYNEDCLMAVLPRFGKRNAPIPEVITLAALTNQYRSSEILETLLTLRSRQLEMTQSILERALQAPYGGMDVLKVLLAYPQDQIPVSLEAISVALIKTGHTHALQHLMMKRSRHMHITDTMMRLTAAREEGGAKILPLLLQELHWGGAVSLVTRDVVEAAAANQTDGFSIMRDLFLSLHDAVPLDQDVLVAVAGNEGVGAEIIQLLLSRLGTGITMTEEMLTAAVGNRAGGLGITRTLLDLPDCRRHITQDVLEAAARRAHPSGWKTVLMMLDSGGDDLVLTQDMLLQLFRHSGEDFAVMKSWLPRFAQVGASIRVTDDVLDALVSNRENFDYEEGRDKALKLLLHASDYKISISEIGMRHLRNSFGFHVARLVLSRQDVLGSNKLITEAFISTRCELGHRESTVADVVSLEADNLQLLLHGRESEAVFTDRAVCGFIRELNYGLIGALWDVLAGSVAMNRAMVEAMMSNDVDGPALLDLLIDFSGDDTRIMAWVIEAAAKRKKTILAQYLRRLGNDASLITARVLQSTIHRSVTKKGVENLEFVLDLASNVPVTDDVLIAAAREEEGSALEILLHHRSRHLKVSESLMMTLLRSGITRQKLEMIRAYAGEDVPFTDNALYACPTSSALQAVLTLRPAGRCSLSQDLVRVFRLTRPSRSSIGDDDERDVFGLLLNLALQANKENPLSEAAVMVEMARSFSNDEFKRYLDSLPSSLPPPLTMTRSIVRAVAREGWSNNESLWMLLVFFSHRDGTVTPRPELLPDIARHFDEEMMDVLLDEWGGGSGEEFITEHVMLGAVQNRQNATAIVKLLLARSGAGLGAGSGAGSGAVITEDVIRAATVSNGHDLVLLKRLIGVYRNTNIGNVVMPQHIMVALLQASMTPQTLSYIMDLCGPRFRITDEVLVLIANSFDLYAMITFLDRPNIHLLLTEAVVRATALGVGRRDEIMRLFLTRLTSNVSVTREGVLQIVQLFTDASLVSILIDGVHDDLIMHELLVEVIRWCDQKLVRHVVRRLPAHADIASCAVIEAAAANKQHGRRILKMLLRENAPSTTLTDDAMQQVARLWDKGFLCALIHPPEPFFINAQTSASTPTQVMPAAERAIDSDGIMGRVTEDVVVAAAQNTRHGRAVLRLCLDYLDDEGIVMEHAARAKVVEVAAANDASAEDLLDLLFERWGDETPVTDRALMAVAGSSSRNAVRLLDLVVAKCGLDKLPMTSGVVMAAAAHSTTDVLAFVLSRWQDIEVTDDVLEIVFEGNKTNVNTIFATVLARRTSSQPLDGRVLVAAAKSDWSVSRLHLLFDHFEGNISLTELELWSIAAAGQPASLRLVLDRWKGAWPVSAPVLAEIAAEFADDITLLRILERFGDSIEFSEAIVSAAARNTLTEWSAEATMYHDDIQWPVSVLRCICNRWAGEVEMTDNIIASAAANKGGKHALEFLVDRWGEDVIMVSEQAVLEAARNPRGRDILEFMVDEWGATKLPVSQDLLVAAAANEDGVDAMEFIAWHWGHLLQPTEDVLQAAAGNPSGRDMLLMIVWKWTAVITDVPMTVHIMETAKRNPEGEDILRLIYERWGTRDVLCSDSEVTVVENVETVNRGSGRCAVVRVPTYAALDRFSENPSALGNS